MRIGALYEWKPNMYYRSLNPLEALARRGHEVVMSKEGSGAVADPLRPERLRGCDVIHAYRDLDARELRLVAELVRNGAGLVWDTDDDLAAVPKESPVYRQTGGMKAQRIFAATVKIARSAHVVTTSTERLAARYREQGIDRVEVLGNFLAPEVVRSRRRKHKGTVIGWTAGLEHQADLARIPVRDALVRLLDAHPDLRIETIGVDLSLPAERYRRYMDVPFGRLQEYVGRWDIGIAPLADIPFNRARSDVKLKEYASVGIPWLASPVGPYTGYGEQQGGRLVADEGWYDALDGLLRSRRERARLGRTARRWAKTQSIERVAERWEQVCEEALRIAQERR